MKYSDNQREVFVDKNIAVLGIGVEGLSSAKFLKQFTSKITFFDQKERSDLDGNTLLEAEETGKVILGKDSFTDFSGFDFIFRSPGVKMDEESLIHAKEKGARITSQTKLFFDLCPSVIIGVTGTKGKGTTSTLIYEILKKSGRKTFLGGNIGTPPLDFLHELDEQSIVVLELSSFQLQDLEKSPHIAVMLMVVPEHLDYHKDVAEYIDAKRNILRFQSKDDFVIINRDYLASNESDLYTDAQVFWVSRERTTTEQGCFVRDNALWMRMRGSEWKIIDGDKIALLGRHNLENASAASVAAMLAGAAKSDIVDVLSSFTGLPHRLEFVREVNGVKYYDDSFSTTPETAIAAIESFKKPMVLILGGSSKHSDFTELGKVIASSEYITTIIGIGDEWPTIKEAIDNAVSKDNESKKKAIYLEGAKDMRTIVQAVSKVAVEGDVVLLSPACASFGIFRNYKDRGNQFKKEVQAL
ncbi:MAG: UDP-N-acetylmuramoyl-L-alanine--D-glutamate ligase [Candidatus Levybacteria bacterium]|nr:UDP-N-acetylmuramoyl-L-alanine--D-glutamate ligase [Candidatus Levybacteria bacterium]